MLAGSGVADLSVAVVAVGGGVWDGVRVALGVLVGVGVRVNVGVRDGVRVLVGVLVRVAVAPGPGEEVVAGVTLALDDAVEVGVGLLGTESSVVATIAGSPAVSSGTAMRA